MPSVMLLNILICLMNEDKPNYLLHGSMFLITFHLKLRVQFREHGVNPSVHKTAMKDWNFIMSLRPLLGEKVHSFKNNAHYSVHYCPRTDC